MSTAPEEFENRPESQERPSHTPASLKELVEYLVEEELIPPPSRAVAMHITDEVDRSVIDTLPNDTSIVTWEETVKNSPGLQDVKYDVHRRADVRAVDEIGGSIQGIQRGEYDLLVRTGNEAGVVSGNNLKHVKKGGVIVTDVTGQELLCWIKEHGKEVVLGQVLVTGEDSILLESREARKFHMAVKKAQDDEPELRTDPAYSIFRKK